MKAWFEAIARKCKYVACMAILLCPLQGFSSGAFMPSGGGQMDERYNLGKAIIIGRISGVQGCKDCHKSFSRGKLKSMDSKVSEFVTNCEKHKPCFLDSLVDKKLLALDAYFSKRYNLR